MKKERFFVFGMLAMALALSFVFAGCDTGTGGGDDGDGGVVSILKGTTWIKEGETSFPKIQYVEDTPAGSDKFAQNAWNPSGFQLDYVFSLTINGNGIYNYDGSTLQYNFELRENNSKLIITNSGANSRFNLDGTWTKR